MLMTGTGQPYGTINSRKMKNAKATVDVNHKSSNLFANTTSTVGDMPSDLAVVDVPLEERVSVNKRLKNKRAKSQSKEFVERSKSIDPDLIRFFEAFASQRQAPRLPIRRGPVDFREDVDKLRKLSAEMRATFARL